MPADGQTIAAIATATGRSAIGIIRLSGLHAVSIASSLIAKLPPPRVPTLCTLREPDGVAIDRCIVIYYAAPDSYTGEDLVEIQTHGSPIVLRDVFRALLDAGARSARPGEFTERAFLNDKIDLLQAEAVADLIDSASSRAARLAVASLSGAFSSTANKVSERLKKLRVTLEAAIDFPDEEISIPAAEEIRAEIDRTRTELKHTLEAGKRGQRLNSGIDIAIIGEPNVGKSTLLNALAGEDRAIVTDIPGTTRDIVSSDIALDGLALRVHDTAGLRDTDDPVEREGVNRAYRVIENADAVFYVHVDGTDGFQQTLDQIAVPIFVIRNKIDLTTLEPRVDTREYGYDVALSARTQQGLDLLKAAVLRAFDVGTTDDNMLLARERHLVQISTALAALNMEWSADDIVSSPEIVAEQLRLACNAIGELTGEYHVEALLGDIFSTFCIGK